MDVCANEGKHSLKDQPSDDSEIRVLFPTDVTVTGSELQRMYSAKALVPIFVSNR